ncbi:hypothetical protein TNCV_2800991 [Trichonephila clavipes]|nr:hypothetical protein TNCV_2800991 [Trichonephila clavipes]
MRFSTLDTGVFHRNKFRHPNLSSISSRSGSFKAKHPVHRSQSTYKDTLTRGWLYTAVENCVVAFLGMDCMFWCVIASTLKATPCEVAISIRARKEITSLAEKLLVHLPLPAPFFWRFVFTTGTKIGIDTD